MGLRAQGLTLHTVLQSGEGEKPAQQTSPREVPKMYKTLSTTTVSGSKRKDMDTSSGELSMEPPLPSSVCVVERTHDGACADWLSSAKADRHATAARVFAAAY